MKIAHGNAITDAILTRAAGGAADITPDAAAGAYEIEVFFDGACPLCAREIALLRWLDRHKRIRYTDIAAAGFDPAGVGRSYAELMARMHGRLADGTWLHGVEVFRRLYAVAGLRRLVALSRLRPVARVLDGAYAAFARNRLRLTGRRCTAQSCSVTRRP